MGLISLLSKGLLRVFPAPQLESTNSLPPSLLYGSTLTSVHDYWKKYIYISIFDYKWVLAKLPQSCRTLRDPMEYNLPSSSVHGILQARILEWVAIPSNRRSSQPKDRTHISYVSCIGRQVLYH